MPDIFLGDKPAEDPKPQQPDVSEANPEDNPNEKEKLETRKQILEFQDHQDHSHSHLFAAYCEKPSGVNFPDRLDEEILILFLRKHFVTNMPWVISAIALLMLPFLVWTIVSVGLISIDVLPSNYIIMITILYYLFVTGFIFTHYLTWFYNIGLVTNLRIIDIDFSSLVFENVDATKLSQVEDVGYKQVGIVRSIFDYGDVHMHTAGPASNFEFLAVPHPEKIINIINGLIGKAHHA
jgi:membrane protein implicated in regulation of membrane protease activity